MWKYRRSYVPNPLQKVHLQFTITKMSCLPLSFPILPACFCWFSLVLLCCETEKSFSSPSHCAARGVRIHCQISPSLVPLPANPRLFNHSWCTRCFRFLVLFFYLLLFFFSMRELELQTTFKMRVPQPISCILCYVFLSLLSLIIPNITLPLHHWVLGWQLQNKNPP